MSAANRRRGGRYESEVAKYLRSIGHEDARRYFSGDSRQPGDIDGIPGVCIEAKDVAQSAWPSWRLQAQNEAGKRVPIVVRRTRGNRDVGGHPAHVLLDGVLDPALPQVYCLRTQKWWVTGSFASVLAMVLDEQEAA